jgi:hypothetical protein
VTAPAGLKKLQPLWKLSLKILSYENFKMFSQMIAENQRTHTGYVSALTRWSVLIGVVIPEAILKMQ